VAPRFWRAARQRVRQAQARQVQVPAQRRLVQVQRLVRLVV
jgi:hypothetical protein